MGVVIYDLFFVILSARPPPIASQNEAAGAKNEFAIAELLYRGIKKACINQEILLDGEATYLV